MALSPNVVVVNPGELVTAAHLNNIRSNLIRNDDRITDLMSDTGTVAITLHANFTGTLAYRRFGVAAIVQISVTKTGANISNTPITFGTLPAGEGVRPTTAVEALLRVSAPADSQRVTINPDGTITAPSLTINGTAFAWGHVSYPASVLP